MTSRRARILPVLSVGLLISLVAGSFELFAAESENLLANAEKKLKSKGADLVVANDITLHGSGFDATKNKVTLISRGEGNGDAPAFLDLPLIDKHAVAGHIMDQVAALLAGFR